MLRSGVDLVVSSSKRVLLFIVKREGMLTPNIPT